MEISKTNRVEATFSKEDLAKILGNELMLEGEKTVIMEMTETEAILGYDPHDCDYVQRFTGIKLIWEK